MTLHSASRCIQKCKIVSPVTSSTDTPTHTLCVAVRPRKLSRHVTFSTSILPSPYTPFPFLFLVLFADVFPSGVVGGKDGGPMIFFDRDSDDAVVFTPMSEFMTATFEARGNDLLAGACMQRSQR